MYGSSSDEGAAFMVRTNDDDAGRARRSEACSYGCMLVAPDSRNMDMTRTPM